MPSGKGSGSKKTQFKKGQTGNAKGQPTIPKEIREWRKLSVEQFIELTCTLFTATPSDWDKKLLDPATTGLEAIVIRILKKTHETGNMAQFDQLLNRILGKAPDTINHTGIAPSILWMRDGSQVQFGLTKKDDEE